MEETHYPPFPNGLQVTLTWIGSALRLVFFIIFSDGIEKVEEFTTIVSVVFDWKLEVKLQLDIGLVLRWF